MPRPPRPSPTTDVTDVDDALSAGATTVSVSDPMLANSVILTEDNMRRLLTNPSRCKSYKDAWLEDNVRLVLGILIERHDVDNDGFVGGHGCSVVCIARTCCAGCKRIDVPL
jgi:hypothetical protein